MQTPDIAPILADLNGAAERIWLDAHETWPALQIDVLPETASTNTLLMDRGRRGDTAPALVVAARQTAGRGRRGRQWEAAPGDTLTFSLGLPLDLEAIPGGASALSLAVGLAVAEALDRGRASLPTQPEAPLESIGLKWPNDLWLGARKLGGILIEACPAPGLTAAQRWVVIGIGLNVRPAPLADGTASLVARTAPVGTAPGLGTVWHWLAPALLTAIRAFAHEGFAPLQTRYRARDVLCGQSVGLWSTPGLYPDAGHPPSQTGIAQGVDEQGALLVHTEEGVQRWHSGDVSVRPQTP